jgi:hypothetical protein
LIEQREEIKRHEEWCNRTESSRGVEFISLLFLNLKFYQRIIWAQAFPLLQLSFSYNKTGEYLTEGIRWKSPPFWEVKAAICLELPCWIPETHIPLRGSGVLKGPMESGHIPLGCQLELIIPTPSQTLLPYWHWPNLPVKLLLFKVQLSQQLTQTLFNILLLSIILNIYTDTKLVYQIEIHNINFDYS